MPDLVRANGGFSYASHQSQALWMGTLGFSGLLWPIAVWGFPSPLRFLAAWVAAGAGACLLVRARRRWTMHGLGEGVPGALGGAMQAANPELLQEGKIHPQVARVLGVASSNFKDAFTLEASRVEFEDDGLGEKRLVTWGLRAVKAGALSEERMQKKVRETFTKSLEGEWKIHFDTEGDVVNATLVDNLPKVAFPDPAAWRPVTSIEEAKKRYRSLKIQLGIGESGALVSTSVWDYPHMQIIGESGAGKSVSVKTILEQLRAAGWMLLIGDGKATDFNGFNVPNPADHGLPPAGTVAYGSGLRQRAMDYIGVIAIAYLELTARQDLEAAASSAGEQVNFPPMFVLLDEIKAIRSKWQSSLTKEENAEVEAMVEQITALGRSFRVHLAVISQDAYRDSIPRSWVGNIRMRLVAGRPTVDTVRKSFEGDKALQSRVDAIRETMSPKDKGRCIITTDNEESGRVDVAQYQNFYTYCPGEVVNPEKDPPGTAEAWSRFKAEVSDRVPRLYSRTWFKIDHKSEAQLELEKETDEDLGFIDFEMFTVAEIKKLKRIRLDMRDSAGEIVPDPENVKYDPSSPLYVCREPQGARAKRYVNLEL